MTWNSIQQEDGGSGWPAWMDSETGQVVYNDPTKPFSDDNGYHAALTGGPSYSGQWRFNNGQVQGINPSTGQWETLYSNGGQGTPALNSSGNALVSNGQSYSPGQTLSSPGWALASQLQAAGLPLGSVGLSPINGALAHDDAANQFGNMLPFLLAGGAAAAIGGGAGLSGLAGDTAGDGGLAALDNTTNLFGNAAAANAANVGGLSTLAGSASPFLADESAGAFASGTPMPAASTINAAGAAPYFASDESPGAFSQGTAMPGSSTIGAAAAATPGLTGTATTAASALSKVLNGTATASDWAQLAGQALPGVLGAYGASQQSGALSDLANKYLDLSAPSRGRYEASMTPGFNPTSIPGYSGALDSASEAILRHLSATGGNPYGNPGGLIEANKQIVNGTALPAIQEYQRLNAGSGGLASLTAAVPGVQQQAIGSQGGVLSGLGSAAANVLNPPSSLESLLKQLGGMGMKVGLA